MKTALKRIIAIVLIAIMIIAIVPAKVSAESEDDSLVVVSLGDSYSSGEGIEPFYYQNEPYAIKSCVYDWLAHRSEKSWPGKISFSTHNGVVVEKLNNYKTNNANSNAKIRWYFMASSGATTYRLPSIRPGLGWLSSGSACGICHRLSPH